MQVIDVWNSDRETAATNLKTALETYASGYFDSYETDFTDSGGEKIVNCKIGSTIAMQFVYKNASDYLQIRFGNVSAKLAISGSDFRTKYIYVLDNAIGFVFATTSMLRMAYPVIMCKKNNGDIGILYSSSISYPNSINSGSTATSGEYATTLYTMDKNNPGTWYRTTLKTTCSSNSDSNVTGYTPFSLHNGDTCKNVFITTSSDFHNQDTPFSYTIDGQEYTGFGGNYLIVKGT